MDLEREILEMLANMERRAEVYDEETGRHIHLILAALERLVLDYRRDNEVREHKGKSITHRTNIENWFYGKHFYEFFSLVNNALSLLGAEFANAHEFVKFIRRQAIENDKEKHV